MRKFLVFLAVFSLVWGFMGCGNGPVDGDQTCVDGDQDGRGENCAAGTDCDDQDNTRWDACPVMLEWGAPTTNTDGSQLTDLAGYRLYWGSAAGGYDHNQDLGLPSCQTTAAGVTCTYTQDGFGVGTHYFAVTAYNAGGYESVFSNEAQKSFP